MQSYVCPFMYVHTMQSYVCPMYVHSEVCFLLKSMGLPEKYWIAAFGMHELCAH